MALLGTAAVAAVVYGAWRPVSRYRTRRLFAHAEQLVRSGHAAAAAAELRQVLQRDPLHREARRTLAQLEVREEHVESAFLHLLSYTEMFPDDADGWVALGDLREKAAQVQEAEAALTQALELDPQRERLRSRRAVLRSRIGRHHGALVDAQAALQRDPQDAQASLVLRTEIARMRAASSGPPPSPGETPLSPRSAAAENWPGALGAALRDFLADLRAKRWEHAGQICRTARQSYPVTMLGPWLEGLVAFSAGETTAAEERFREALAVSPRSHRVITNLIVLWSRQGGPASTGDHLVALTERDPGFTYPLPIAARAYLEASQPSQAEATVRRMFRLLPASPSPYREVATFFLFVDRASDAISTAADGLVRFPADADLHLLQARASLQLGDREAAIRAYDAALSLRPDDQLAAAQLARLLVTVRKDDAARARALELVRNLEFDEPSDAEVLTAMAAVTLTAGRDPRRSRHWLESARAVAPDDPEVGRLAREIEAAQRPR
jgi:tetratricopeptide (TPR) repeat protein